MSSAHTVQMRWRDLDGLGHVNHTVVLTYLEEGRDAFLLERGITRDNYVVGRCEISFVGEILPEFRTVTVQCGVHEVGRKSVTTAERVLDPEGNALVEARFGLVLWDPEQHDTRPVSDAERAALAPAAEERG